MPRLMGGRAWKAVLVASAVANCLLLLKVYNAYGSIPCPEYDYQTGGEGVAARSLLSGKAAGSVNVSSDLDLKSRQVIFVGGVPRSGTTLMRAMLDAHPEVRCGEETRVIPRIVGMRSRWDKSEREHNRLEAAGLTGATLDSATRAFISEIILNHGSPAKYLCNKDPLVLNYMEDIVRLFPKARFVLLVRDGRAVANSIVSRNITISGVDHRSYMSAALFWNKVVNKMLQDCKSNEERCLIVFYEKLVAAPREGMTQVLDFLSVPWSENVLHHHELINKEVSLSKLEPSSNQVKEAVNTAAVDKWRQKIPKDLQKQIYKECFMLEELGYPP